MINDNDLILAIETSGRLGSVLIAEGEQSLAEKHFTGPMRHSAEIFPAIVELLNQFNKKSTDIAQVYISIGPGSFTGLRIAVTIAKTLALANQTKIVAVDTLDAIAANVLRTEDPSSLKLRRAGRGQRTENGGQKTVRSGVSPSSETEISPSSVIGHPFASAKRSEDGSSDLLAVILDAKRSQFFIAVYEDLSFPRRRESISFPLNKILPDSLLTAEEFFARFTDKPIALIGEGLVFYKDKFTHKNVRILDEKLWYPSAANVYKLGFEKAKKGQFTDPLTLTPNYIRGPDAIVKTII